ncbi:MAG: helix-turn-helix transcriptional regulator [Bacillota bacterium]|nr:helix-turn-helix transcriptional regulator [Bacillota bacterium]
MQEFKVIGEKLRQLRLEREESLEEVARKTELTKSLLSRYERGLVDPGLKALRNLVTYFNVSLDWLFGFTEDRRPINTSNPLEGLSDKKKVEVISYIEFLKSKE